MSYQPPNQPSYPPAPYGQPQPQPTGNYYPPPYPQPSGYPPPAIGYAPPSQTIVTQPQPQPVVTQPVAGQGQYGSPMDGLMALPAQVNTQIPPGLQYLASIDQLLVKQEFEVLETFIGWETNNKYTVKNNTGQRVYVAMEQNDWLTRLCCGTLRSFDIRIVDNYGHEVIHLHRDFRCNSCWYPCCLQKLEVYSPPGVLCGTVEQTWALCTPVFDIKNEMGTTVLKLEGPICRYSICGDIEFKVLTLDKSVVVGKIAKQWGGLLREAFTDADYFGISFPLDLDVRMKAVMLGACFLIDFMYFEKSGNKEHDRPGNFG